VSKPYGSLGPCEPNPDVTGRPFVEVEVWRPSLIGAEKPRLGPYSIGYGEDARKADRRNLRDFIMILVGTLMGMMWAYLTGWR
jgi:hypothetical protein